MAFANDRGMRANKPLDLAYLKVFNHLWDIVWIDYNMSSESDLELWPSGRNETLIMVGMAIFFKSPSFELGEVLKSARSKWKVHIDAIQILRGGLANKACSSIPPSQNNSNGGMQPSLDVDGERHPLEKQRCLTKVQWAFEKWWKNHILPQHGKERKGANETYLDDILSFVKSCYSKIWGLGIIYNNHYQKAMKLEFYSTS